MTISLSTFGAMNWTLESAMAKPRQSNHRYDTLTEPFLTPIFDTERAKSRRLFPKRMHFLSYDEHIYKKCIHTSNLAMMRGKCKPLSMEYQLQG